MGLRSEQRDSLHRLAHDDNLNPGSQKWLQAVEEHLAACESLLREIAKYPTEIHSTERPLRFVFHDWQAKARALLGPAE